MKILILANSSGGLYGFRKELIISLKKEHEVIAIVPIKNAKEELEAIGCEVIDVPLDRRGINPIIDAKLVLAYFKKIKKIKPDLVITYTIKPNIYGGIVCRLLRIPYAMNITGLGTAFERGGMLTKFVTTLYKCASQKARVLFFENSVNRDIFVNKNIVPVKKTYLLNGAGVNLEQYSVSKYPEGEIVKFLFIGRIMAEKGVNELFAAMKKLILSGMKAELHVLGLYEENYKSVIDMYEKEGWMHYHGFQKDVRPFIQDCHCFVLPSWHEGMANTNLECAASGRPVITSNIPGCLEAVKDGVTGYLIEKKNVDSLYYVMRKFMGLSYVEREEMGLAGRKHMEENFDKKNVVKETILHLVGDKNE